MKIFYSVIAVIISALILCSCAPGAVRTVPRTPTEPVIPDDGPVTTAESASKEAEKMIYANVSGVFLEIEPADNSSARAFMDLLADGDITVDMKDYGGFEKVGDLGTELCTNDETITAVPGDVILYNGNQITIYYGENTYSLTRLGKVVNMSGEELKEALGEGESTAIFSLRN